MFDLNVFPSEANTLKLLESEQHDISGQDFVLQNT